MELILHRASIKRRSRTWQDENYNVLDGKRAIGRIYRVDADGGRATWLVTGRKSAATRTHLKRPRRRSAPNAPQVIQ